MGMTVKEMINADAEVGVFYTDEEKEDLEKYMNIYDLRPSLINQTYELSMLGFKLYEAGSEAMRSVNYDSDDFADVKKNLEEVQKLKDKITEMQIRIYITMERGKDM